MQRNAKLDCFVLVEGGTIISPILTTTRQYGIWLSNTFDEYTVAQELYLKSKRGDDSLLESHPGTKIGNYFDSNKFTKYEMQCWYIAKDSKMMERLVKYGLADFNDCYRYNQRQMLRVYTVDQIQLYLRTKVDKQFDIGNDMLTPKEVVVYDINDIIKPERTKRKGLF